MIRQRKNERGVALIAVAVFLSALLALTAVAIDIGRLAHTATEVQTVADAAARGGAKALLDGNGVAGLGIARAHLIAHKNLMDGAFSPDADVFVDEGFYDVETRNFQCCTSNGPCCAGGSWGDLNCVASPQSCAKRGAVLVTPHATVHNLFAGIFDFFDNGRISATAAAGSPNANSKIERIAIGSAGGPGQGCQPPAGCAPNNWACYCTQGVAPCLPIAAPECEFNGFGSLPSLKVSSSGSDTAFWTGFQTGHNDVAVRSFMNQGSCQPNGTHRTITEQDVGGSDIDVTNGINSSGNNNVFDLMKCIYDNNLGCKDTNNDGVIDGAGGRIFTIPIFDMASPCTLNASGNQSIVGFATVKITSVTISGSTKRIDIQTINNSTNPSSGGGGICFSSNCNVALNW